MYRHCVASLAVRAALIASLAAAAAHADEAAGSLPGPAARYTDGASAHLDWFDAPAGPAMLFSLGRPGASAAHTPPAEQAAILDRLLGRLIEARTDLPETFQVMLGDSRAALVEAADRDLLRAGADWDAARGRPRRGRFGPVLKAAVSRAVRSSPIAGVFAAHGYALDVTGVGRIDVRPVASFGGARLPASIDVISLAARKQPPGEEPHP